MKLGKLVDPQYQATLKKLASQEIPLRTAFKLRGIIKTAGDELSKYDEVRGEALKRLGSKKEDGSLEVDDKGVVKLSEENMSVFVAQLNELLAAEVNLGNIKINELGDKATLTANELLILDGFIVE